MCVCVCACVCVFVCLHTHTHTHTYIYIYIYVHLNRVKISFSPMQSSEAAFYSRVEQYGKANLVCGAFYLAKGQDLCENCSNLIGILDTI